jgi:hypothetical protein
MRRRVLFVVASVVFYFFMGCPFHWFS